MGDETKRELADPGDPYEAMAESFRRGVISMVLDAMGTTVYREMPASKKLESFLAGGLSGIVGVCFSLVDEKSRDYIMEYLVECLPIARRIAEENESLHGIGGQS